MASVLTQANIGINLGWTYTVTVPGFGQTSYQPPNPSQYQASLSNGTGAIGTANQLYVAQLTIALSSNTTLTFSSGLTDPLGAALAMARIKYLFINNSILGTASAIVVGNATNPLPLFSAPTATITLNNNGLFMTGDPGAAGIVVTSSASDSLKIANSDGSHAATVNIIAIGSTA